AGLEVGLLLSWMSGRVLGQYDLLFAEGADEGDVVYFVGENIVALEREHRFPPDQFRLWIAIHEVTHRMQFTGVPWMRDYFLGLVERGVQASPPDARALLESLRRAAGELRAGRNPLADGGVVGLLATSEQLATLREAQALMSLLEGHGDVVMGRAAGPQVPEASRFAATLQRRREGARGMAKVVQQVIGIESKLRQYAEGEAFVDAVLAAGGDELVARLWEGPEMLPSIEEIREPQRWLDRVLGDRPPVEIGSGPADPS
ncbi:MAG TPA: zinc-dependent metalloprotease, partial [Acidimicrobiales bacterium]|nr:zinc-dependent metalloprotease [Acidimicrobiales bacterium]